MSILANDTPDADAPRVPHRNQFQFHFEENEVPVSLYRAATNLTDIVLNGLHGSEAEEIVAQREAIAFCRRALDEIELICDYSARCASDRLRAELARLERAGGEA
jgi:hypothetical protein